MSNGQQHIEGFETFVFPGSPAGPNVTIDDLDLDDRYSVILQPPKGRRAIALDLDRVMPRETIKIEKKDIFDPDHIAYATDGLEECVHGAFYEARQNVTVIDPLGTKNPERLFKQLSDELVGHLETCLDNTNTALYETPKVYQKIYEQAKAQASKQKGYSLGGHLQGLDETRKGAVKRGERSLRRSGRMLAETNASNSMYEKLQQETMRLGAEYMRSVDGWLEADGACVRYGQRTDEVSRGLYTKSKELADRYLGEYDSYRYQIFEELVLPLYRTMPEGVWRVVSYGYESKNVAPDVVRYLENEKWLMNFGFRVETKLNKQNDTTSARGEIGRGEVAEDGANVLEAGDQIDTVITDAEIRRFLSVAESVTTKRQMNAASDALIATTTTGEQRLQAAAEQFEDIYRAADIMVAHNTRIAEQLDRYRVTLDDEQAVVIETLNELARKLRGDIRDLRDTSKDIFKEERELAVHIRRAELDEDQDGVADLESVVVALRLQWLNLFNTRWPGTVDPLRYALATVADRVQQISSQRVITSQPVTAYYEQIAARGARREWELYEDAPQQPQVSIGKRAIAALFGRR